jgi:hypothetical protein
MRAAQQHRLLRDDIDPAAVGRQIHLSYNGALFAWAGLHLTDDGFRLAVQHGLWTTLASFGSDNHRAEFLGRLRSIGPELSPRLNADAQDEVPVTVHLGDVTDVVIVEGLMAGQNSDCEVLDAYNAKYDWDYTIGEYGPFTTVAPLKVGAWRSAGWAGREGFQQTGKWRFDPPRS